MENLLIKKRIIQCGKDAGNSYAKDTKVIILNATESCIAPCKGWAV